MDADPSCRPQRDDATVDDSRRRAERLRATSVTSVSETDVFNKNRLTEARIQPMRCARSLRPCSRLLIVVVVIVILIAAQHLQRVEGRIQLGRLGRRWLVGRGWRIDRLALALRFGVRRWLRGAACVASSRGRIAAASAAAAAAAARAIR